VNSAGGSLSMFVVAFLIVALVGDFASTFGYHVPQHLWFKLHLRTHHDRSRSYWDHAVISKDPEVMLDGFLGAIPYLIVAAPFFFFGPFAIAGAVFALVLGQLHVWWRHTTDLGWKSPVVVRAFCRFFHIVLPEDHDGHHRNPDIEFGDLFRFYDAPARAMVGYVRKIQRRRRTALKRLQRIQAIRMTRRAQQA